MYNRFKDILLYGGGLSQSRKGRLHKVLGATQGSNLTVTKKKKIRPVLGPDTAAAHHSSNNEHSHQG